MTDLQKQFESTGYASWINSEIYPDGQIYTKEYTEWLENKVKTQLSAPSFLEAIKSEPTTMQNQEKIIQAIAAIIDENLNHAHIGYEIDCTSIAASIAAAIAPHLEAGAEPKDYPYSELFDHMANEHGLTLTNTELGDIIHIARGEGTKTGWEDAPGLAKWLNRKLNRITKL